MTDQEMLELPKLVHNWSGFRKRDNHAGSLIAVGQLSDRSNVWVQGLTFEIEVRAAAVADRCLMLFTLHHRAGKQKRRVYQLEVCPATKQSHNGSPPLFGPHEHLPDNTVEPVLHADVQCNNFSGSLNWFLSRANITSFSVEDPYAEL